MNSISSINEDIIQGQILNAARQLFQKYGFRKVTMDDIAKAIGKGRSSLYYYYKSKEEVFDAVVDVEIREIVSETALAVDKASTAEEKIHAFCATKLNVLLKKRVIFNAWRSDLETDETINFTKTADNIRRRYRVQESNLLKQILMHGVKKGELKPLKEKELDVLTIAIINSLQGFKRELTGNDDPSRMEMAVNILCGMIMHGLKK